jgi:hypothetical protein
LRRITIRASAERHVACARVAQPCANRRCRTRPRATMRRARAWMTTAARSHDVYLCHEARRTQHILASTAAQLCATHNVRRTDTQRATHSHICFAGCPVCGDTHTHHYYSLAAQLCITHSVRRTHILFRRLSGARRHTHSSVHRLPGV